MKSTAADAEEGSSTADATTPPPARLSQLAAMAALSGTGNGVALKSGGFVLARLVVAGKPVGAFVEGSVGAALYLGMLCGSLVAGWMAQRYGRKVAIGFGEAWVLLVSLAFGFVPGADWVVAWRAMLGVGVGVCAMGKPLYLAECAPSPYRGRVLCLFALCFPLGYGTCRWSSSTGTPTAAMAGAYSPLQPLTAPYSPLQPLTSPYRASTASATRR